LKLAWSYFRVLMLSLMRSPSYYVPTLVFPTMLYLFFATNLVDDVPSVKNTVILASWSVFGVLGVTFYQFGVGLAQDRESHWSDYLRSLPAGALPRFLGRIASALAFAMATVALLWLVAFRIGPPVLDPGSLGLLLGCLFVGVIPFTCLGMAIGYWANAKSAVAIANLIYLPLSFAGGLWLPPGKLPEVVRGISELTPTRHFGEIAWAAARSEIAQPAHWFWLLAYTVVFFAIALWGYRRDEGRRYG